MNPAQREIVLRGGDYDHVSGIDGSADGMIRLAYRPMRLQEIFISMLTQRAFEACEFSLANYLILRAAGQDWLSAIAVFPHRAFRHSLIVTRRDSPMTDLAHLAGKRIALEDYSMTAAVWVRILLREDHGVDHRSITWVTPRAQRLPIPAGARVEHTDDDLETLLETGRVDAMLGFYLRDRMRPAAEQRLRPLLSDFAAVERDYFERTQIYPINHCIVVRNDVLAELPTLPGLVAQSYARAKSSAYARRSPTVLPWGTAHWDEDMRLFGDDPLPYGLNAINRKVVGALAEGLREQGFIATPPPLDRLFVA